MIASCWDWPSLKYQYFIISDKPLDAGGWSPTRGIERSSKTARSDQSIQFDDCLPSLPKSCFFAGVGNECVGELFAKRDSESRPSVDLKRMQVSQNPREVKAAELILDNSRPLLKANPSDKIPSPGDSSTENTNSAGSTNRGSIWGRLVPAVASVSTGYVMYRSFQSMTESRMALKNVLLAWGAGLAIGLTIGQESLRNTKIEKDLKR